MLLANILSEHTELAHTNSIDRKTLPRFDDASDCFAVEYPVGENPANLMSLPQKVPSH